MNKNRCRWVVVVLSLLVVFSGVALAAPETRYEAATDGTAEVTFAPAADNAEVAVVAGVMRVDYSGSLKFYAKASDAARYTPAIMFEALSTNVIVVSTNGLALNDHMVFYDVSGGRGYHYLVQALPSATNVVLNGQVPVACEAGDQLYKVSLAGQMDSIATSATSVAVSANLFVSPAESPVYAVLTATGGATSNTTLMITAER